MEISNTPLKLMNLVPIQEISTIGERVKIALVPFLNDRSLRTNHTFEIDPRSLYHIPEIARIAAADLLKRRKPFNARVRPMKGKRLTLLPQHTLTEGESLALRKLIQEDEEDDRFSSLFGKKKKKKREKERN